MRRFTFPLLDVTQRHSRLLAWLAVYVVFFTLTMRHVSPQIAMLAAAETMLPMVIISEVLRRLLIPRFLQRRPWLFFCLSLLLLWGLNTWAAWQDRQTLAWLSLPMPGRRDGNTGNPAIYFNLKYTFLLIVTAAQTTVSWLLSERKHLTEQIRESRMQMELKLLRSQINPHFLFNALNCVYSLAVTKDDRTGLSVLRLSDMLRYVIDDCAAERVPLAKEVRYIENYIDFQRLRMEHAADITFDAPPAERGTSLMVPPMIFQPMLENCFKHSRIVEYDDAFVHLALTEDNSRLTFTAENSIPRHRTGNDDERQGIGMQNVRQRLDLLYADRYSLTAVEDGGTFRTQLVIEL